MVALHTPATHPSQVSAMYPDGWEFFDLPAGATLVELAGRLDTLANSHDGEAIAVNIHFKASPHQSSTAIHSTAVTH